MSRSNPTAKNPATRFFQWSGGAEKITELKKIGGKEKRIEKYIGGKVTYYDKEAGVNVEMDLPFNFLVLDELHTITGFSKANQSGFWSNEVRDLKTGELVVRTKNGVVARGTYNSIKDEIKAQGAKYTKSVYIAYKNDQGELVLGNIKMGGSALNGWIDFNKQFNVEKCAVAITGGAQAKNGITVYFTPIFEGLNTTPATEKAAQALDVELQNYLETYMSRRPDAFDEKTVEDEPSDDDDEEEIEDLGTAKELGDAPKKQPARAVTANEDDDEDEEQEDDGSSHGKSIPIGDVPF